MHDRIARFDLVVGILFATAAVRFASGAGGAAEEKPFPSFAAVRQTVLGHFRQLPDHRPGDIIARSDVEPVFAELKRLGWTVADRQSILRKVAGDDAYLVRKLRTRQGRQFMHKIAKYPHAYDRLERLSRLPHGKQTVHDLIHKVGGHEMIEYMATTRGGKNLGGQLSNAPKGRNFNQPTGRIYTVDILLEVLEQSHAAAKQPPSESKPGRPTVTAPPGRST